MTRLGIGLPNRRLEPAELDQVLALGCTDYLLYLVGNPLYWQGLAAAIHERQPAARFHVRLEARGALDPQGDVVRVHDAARLLGDLVTSLCARNEPQLESPGVTPGQWRDYLRAFIAALPAELRGRVAIPPLCPEIALDEWLRASVEGGQGLGLMHAHVYGDAATVAARLATIRHHWSGRLVVTEWNYGAGRAVSDGEWAALVPGVVAAAAEYDVEALCVFIWAWQAPDIPLPTTVDVAACSAVQQALRLAAAAAREETPMIEGKLGDVAVLDLRDRYPEVGSRFPRRDPKSIASVVMHHTEGSTPHGVKAALEMLDAIHRYHTTHVDAANGMPWPGIAYALAIDGDGTIYGCQGLDLTTYHAKGANACSVGVAWLGDYSDQAPSPGQVEAAARLFRALEQEVGHGLTLLGHRDLTPTVCPGSHWPQTRAAMLGETVAVPSPSAVTAALDGAWHFSMLSDQTARETLASNQRVREKIVALKVALGIQ